MKDRVNPVNDTLTRLPCRGCLSSCKDYANCDGRPWRLSMEVIETKEIGKKIYIAQGEEN